MIPIEENFSNETNSMLSTINATSSNTNHKAKTAKLQPHQLTPLIPNPTTALKSHLFI